MAKIRLGAIAGAISGSVGTWTFAHNRGGAYVRNRTSPDKWTSTPALDAKGRLSQLSTAWSTKPIGARLQWAGWAQGHPIVDTLGEKRILTGHQAYIQVNVREMIAGTTILDSPPSGGPPLTIPSLALYTDIGAGDFQLNWAGVLDTAEHVWLTACYSESIAINYIKNLVKFVAVSPAAQTTGWDIQGACTTRLGAPQIGHILHVRVYRWDHVTGQMSQPQQLASIIKST